MSITFHVAGYRPDCDNPFECERCRRHQLNLSNLNALDLLRWLDLEPAYIGTIAAGELAARCRRRLWDEPRNHDVGLAALASARYVFCGRPPGGLREATAALLVVAETARSLDQPVCWG